MSSVICGKSAASRKILQQSGPLLAKIWCSNLGEMEVINSSIVWLVRESSAGLYFERPPYFEEISLCPLQKLLRSLKFWRCFRKMAGFFCQKKRSVNKKAVLKTHGHAWTAGSHSERRCPLVLLRLRSSASSDCTQKRETKSVDAEHWSSWHDVVFLLVGLVTVGHY